MSEKLDLHSVNADDLVERVAKRYSSCRTYQDDGWTEGSLGRLEFKTSFVRPRRFRFNWQFCNGVNDDLQVNQISSDGLTAYEHYHGRSKEVCENINRAVAGATGVSQGTVHTLAKLLMPELISGASLFGLSFDAFNTEVVYDQLCYHLCSVPQNDHIPRVELWITPDMALKRYRVEIATRAALNEESVAEVVNKITSAELKARLLDAVARSEVTPTFADTIFTQIIFDEDVAHEVFV